MRELPGDYRLRIFVLHTVAESTCDRKKFSQAERDGATLSWSFCFPLSLIGVKCIAAWTFSSRRAICSEPMTTEATGWLRLNCRSSPGDARPGPLPTIMPWPITFIERIPMFFCSATGSADCSKDGIGSILRAAIGLADCAALSDI